MNAKPEYWSLCQELLKERVDRPSFDRWLDPLRVDWGVDRVTVIAANAWISRQVEAEFGSQIAEAVHEVAPEEQLEVTYNYLPETGVPKPLRVEKTNRTEHAAKLEPSYTFKRFLPGETKRAEKAAAIEVAETFSSDLATVVILGTTGLGKSHLLHAIGHHIYDQFPDKKVKLTHSTTFVNDVTSALRPSSPRKASVSETMQKVHNQYLKYDVVMLDDLHRLVGKEKTQEEFLQLVDQWQSRGTKLVFASLGTADELVGLSSPLRSRLFGGLSIQAMEPEPSLKVQILLQQAAQEDYNLPLAVAEHLAEQMTSDIRVLKGTLLSIVRAQPLVHGRRQPLTREAVDEALTKRNLKRQAITTDRILAEVGRYFKVTADEIRSSTRVRSKLLPRQLGMMLAHELTPLPLTEIARAFGRKDHTTVKHAIETLPSKMAKNTDLRRDYDRLVHELKK